MFTLLSDIGGTNIRFLLLKDDNVTSFQQYKTCEFLSLDDVLDLYLSSVNIKPNKMVLGVAGLVNNPIIKLTNADLDINKTRLSEKYPDTKIVFVNDFVLQGYGVLQTKEKDLRFLTGNSIAPLLKKEPMLVLGPGTGLGSCFLIPNDEGVYHVLSSEAGHTLVSPITFNQQKILSEMSKEEQPISFENIISGSGLCRLYQAILKINQLMPDSEWLKEVELMKETFMPKNIIESSFIPLRSVDITSLAEKGDEVALLTFWYFFEFLGIYASNLALTLKTSGGVYLVGGLLNNLVIKGFLLKSMFKKNFEAKGVFANYMKTVPVYLVEKPDIQIDGLVYLSKSI